VKTTDSVSVKITKRICRDPIFSRFNMKTIWLMCMMFGILSVSLAWSQRPPDANDGCVAVSGNAPYRCPNGSGCGTYYTTRAETAT